jgi:hypothetical protein
MEKYSFYVEFMHTCINNLFLGVVNDKGIKMIEIDELLLFYYFIPCFEKYKENGFWVMFSKVVFGSLQLMVTHKLYLSFKFKYILLHFQKCKHPLSINWLMVIEMAFLLLAFVVDSPPLPMSNFSLVIGRVYKTY